MTMAIHSKRTDTKNHVHARHIEEMDKEFRTLSFDSVQGAVFSKANASSNSIVDWINKRESTCFICDSVNKTFNAYT